MLVPCLCPLRPADKAGVDPRRHVQCGDTSAMQNTKQALLLCDVTTEVLVKWKIKNEQN